MCIDATIPTSSVQSQLLKSVSSVLTQTVIPTQSSMSPTVTTDNRKTVIM